MLKCSDQPYIWTQIRVYSPANYVEPDRTMAYVIGKLSLRDVITHEDGSITGALIDAIVIVPIPGDPSADNYEDCCPDMLSYVWYVVLC